MQGAPALCPPARFGGLFCAHRLSLDGGLGDSSQRHGSGGVREPARAGASARKWARERHLRAVFGPV